MNNGGLLLLAIGLSMDAFAVSVTNGMCKKNIKFGWTFLMALTFGVFQGIMPVIGYFIGSKFSRYVSKYDNYIALALLGFIGVQMIISGIKSRKNIQTVVLKMTLGDLIIQAFATSIDALSVGVSFAVMDINIVYASAVICATTFVLCIIAVFVGKKFGNALNDKAEIVGGIILISIGLKIFFS